MHRKTITITEKMEDHIRAKVKSGDYGNDSEYVRDLIRKDVERAEAEDKLRMLLQEALDSGISEKTPSQIFEEALAKIDSAA